MKTLLSKSRLLTLTGSGGCGKTRLSQQSAADLLEQFPDGVWQVELAPLADPAILPQTVASVVSVREAPGEPLIKTLAAALKEKQLLLILDNCEHLLDASARLVDTLLQSCPKVKLLVSSREALGLSGENTYRVPSLALPDLKQTQTASSLAHIESAHLFVERASAVKTDFAVTDQNASALAAVCARLDGIPLAIELAAARIRTMTVEDLGKRLDDRFRILTGGSRTALPRQQTLRALIDWSYDLLEENQKLLLARLSIFFGGWTLEAAEAVCSGEGVEEWEVLDLLTALSDKSLVIAEARGAATRYRLLETVRQYGRERLVESGDGEIVPIRARHRNYYLALAEEIMPKLRSTDQAHWLVMLETEHDNLRQALAFCLGAPEGGEAGLHLVRALQQFWAIRGHLSEGRQHLTVALSRPVGPAHQQVRADALTGAGNLANHQGDYVAARTFYEENLAIRRNWEDKQGIAACLSNLGNVVQNQGDYAVVHTLQEESLALRRELGDKRGIAAAVHNLGNVVALQGDYATARALHEEGLSIFRELGDKQNIAVLLFNLGHIAIDGQSNYIAARALYSESLSIFQELGYKHGIIASFDAHASLAHQQQETKRAARLWGAATFLRKDIGLPRPPYEQEKYDQQTEQSRETLGEAAFVAAYEEGQAMTLEKAIEYALSKSQ